MSRLILSHAYTETPKVGSYMPLPPLTPEYLSTTEAGKLLRVGERVIGLYINTLGLKASRIGKRYLISRSDLDAFVKSRALSAPEVK